MLQREFRSESTKRTYRAGLESILFDRRRRYFACNRKFGIDKNRFSYISSGGAFITHLSGKPMLGIGALKATKE